MICGLAYLPHDYSTLQCHKHGPKLPVHGELMVKPLREADKALGSESANERFSTWSAICDRLPLLQPARRRRESCVRDDGCNTFGSP